MRGIVLAGGNGTRLWPSTKAISKQLLHVYDKPMIYYALSTLFLAKISEICIITTPHDQGLYVRLLGDGSQFGASLTYAVQHEPRGLAESLIIAGDFLGESSCSLILGDNLFYGQGLGGQLAQYNMINGAQIFAYAVNDPQNYGIVELNKDGVPISLEEKPVTPKSNLAVPGLYFFDNQVTHYAREVVPSSRGELEITEINKKYLEAGDLKVNVLPRGTAWLDTGTVEGLHDAATFVRVIEQRQGTKIGCLEEIAWRNKWISNDDLYRLASIYRGSAYGIYLESLFKNL